MAGAGQVLALHDREKSGAGRLLLAGVDEAGRGSWAGPVVAAAVILPADWCPDGLDDSKRLTPGQREKLYEEIRASALDWGACAVSCVEIDRTNILRATMLAMVRAVGRFKTAPDRVLVDGNRAPELDLPVETIVGGDGRSACVAAASVLAKVLRDRVMVAWDRHFPGYGFASHKGYGAAAHRDALTRLGPCPQHRLTFRPLADRHQDRLF